MRVCQGQWMGFLLTTASALCIWVMLWAVGTNGFDAFLIVPGAVLMAAMTRTMRTTPRGNRVGVVWSARTVGIWLAAIGLALWGAGVASTNDVSARLSDLGAGLLSGAVVAFAVFLLQQRFDREAETQSLRVTVGLQKDLGHADLSNRELSGFSFDGKDLTSANLSGAALRGASFVRATLRETRFVEADLTDAKFSFADLDDVSFALAELSEAVFTDARNISAASFTTAWCLRGKAPTFSDSTRIQIDEK